MTGCLDQLSYWASFWWESFSQNAENHESFGIFWSKYFCHIFMVYLTKACSFEYSLFTSQVSMLFMAIKKNDNLIDNFTNDATNLASDG